MPFYRKDSVTDYKITLQERTDRSEPDILFFYGMRSSWGSLKDCILFTVPDRTEPIYSKLLEILANMSLDELNEYSFQHRLVEGDTVTITIGHYEAEEEE